MFVSASRLAGAARWILYGVLVVGDYRLKNYYESEDFAVEKFYCPHVFADGKSRISF